MSESEVVRAAVARLRDRIRSDRALDAEIGYDVMLVTNEAMAPSRMGHHGDCPWCHLPASEMSRLYGRKLPGVEYEPVLEPEPESYQCGCGRRLPCRHCDGKAGAS